MEAYTARVFSRWGWCNFSAFWKKLHLFYPQNVVNNRGFWTNKHGVRASIRSTWHGSDRLNRTDRVWELHHLARSSGFGHDSSSGIDNRVTSASQALLAGLARSVGVLPQLPWSSGGSVERWRSSFFPSHSHVSTWDFFKNWDVVGGVAHRERSQRGECAGRSERLGAVGWFVSLTYFMDNFSLIPNMN